MLIWLFIVYYLFKTFPLRDICRKALLEPNRKYCTVQYYTIQYCTVQCSTIQYCTIQYCRVQCSTVQNTRLLYCTVLFSAVQYRTVQYRKQTWQDIFIIRDHTETWKGGTFWETFRHLRPPPNIWFSDYCFKFSQFGPRATSHNFQSYFLPVDFLPPSGQGTG